MATISERDFFDVKNYRLSFEGIKPYELYQRRAFYVVRNIGPLVLYACGPSSLDYEPRSWSRDKTKAVLYPGYVASRMKSKARRDYGSDQKPDIILVLLDM